MRTVKGVEVEEEGLEYLLEVEEEVEEQVEPLRMQTMKSYSC